MLFDDGNKNRIHFIESLENTLPYISYTCFRVLCADGVADASSLQTKIGEFYELRTSSRMVYYYVAIEAFMHFNYKIYI